MAVPCPRSVDHDLLHWVQALHWWLLDDAFRGLSAWWVKSLVVIAIGCAADLAARRRFPVAGVYAAVSYAVAEGVSLALKVAVGRPRPHVHHLVGAYGSSFPSGHRRPPLPPASRSATCTGACSRRSSGSPR